MKPQDAWIETMLFALAGVLICLGLTLIIVEAL